MKKLNLKSLKRKLSPKNLLNKIPLYGDKTLIISFEFGLVLSQTAQEMEVELTPKMIERAEDILIKELKVNGYRKTALNFIPLILAVLEVK